MKKSFVLFVVVLVCTSFFAWSEDADFTGFEGRALSVAEARLVSGGETYVGYTHVAFGAYHTLTVVTDKPITDPTFDVTAVYESGSGWSRSSSSSWGFGYNIKRDYNKKGKVKANPKFYRLEKVTPAKGMSIKEYDRKIVTVAEAYFKEKPRWYSVWNNSCNTTTSTIIRRSGGHFKPTKWVPGWKW